MPGLPDPTYLDAGFADRLKRFDKYANDRGVQPQYISGYRTPEQQDAIRNSGQGITPAQRSLHSAGLAADVQLRGKSAEEQQILRDAATQAGLSWGGMFISISIPAATADG